MGRLRHLGTYALILLAGMGVVAVVLPVGRGLRSAAEAPEVLEVSGPGSSCLGDRVHTVQSGVLLDLHTPPGDGERTGERLAGGRVDPATDRATLHGHCRDGDAMAVRVLVGPEGIEGDVEVGGERLALTGAATEVASRGDAPSERMTGSELVSRLFLAVAVVIAAARVVGAGFRRIRQPRVVGEIVAGIVLGPSVVGAVWPAATDFLFPVEVTDVLKVIAQLGLVFFMFLVGMHLDLAQVARSGRTAVLVSHVSIMVPFALGVGVALVIYPPFGRGDFAPFALFMGVAMAITAFPVLARILTDTGLEHTRLGNLAIACAAVDDLTAWCVLSVVVGIARSAGAGEAATTIGLTALFVVGMLVVVRRVVARVVPPLPDGAALSPTVFGGLVVLVLVAAWLAEEIGIHAVFGAFLAGAVMPRSERLHQEVSTRLEDVSSLVLLPVFFAIAGLSTRVELLAQPSVWAAMVLVTLVAIVGKWGGSTLAARASRLPWREAGALGVLMNARGLTEIVVLTVGLDLEIITPVVFTIMVMMALITTLMTTPLLAWILPGQVSLQARELAPTTA